MTASLPDCATIRQIIRECAANGHAIRGAEVYDVGTDGYMDYLERELLDGFIARGGSTCRFYQGEAGSGKTHILRLIESRALRRGYAVANVELGVLSSLNEWDKITKDIISNISIQRGGERIEGLLEILDHYAGRSRSLNQLSVRHPCYRNAMQFILNGPEEDSPARTVVSNYLRGEKVTVSQLKGVKVKGIKRYLTDRNAESVLLTALQCLGNIGVERDPLPGVVLLLDEADNTWKEKESKRKRTASSEVDNTGKRGEKENERTANYVRRFVDASKNGEMYNTLAAFGILPTFIDGCRQALPPLHQRLDMVWMDGGGVPWRYPVLPVSAVNSTTLTSDAKAGRMLFLQEACDKLVRIAVHCNWDTKGLREELMLEGEDVLAKNVGSGYRRELIKRLMARFIMRLDTM